ncbi:MAG: hypothetical protein O2944_04510 [Proteobacteria bacterium]|nr:hypothetical protein [Pseudomonadota bacterium]
MFDHDFVHHAPDQHRPTTESERQEAVEHILRYELFRHRDLAEQLSNFLGVNENPAGINRSTWDILFYLMQCHLENIKPSVTDIYVSTGISKGTAITGLTELETRSATRKARDSVDGRRRRLELSIDVTKILEGFVAKTTLQMIQPLSQDPVAYRPSPLIPANADPLINVLNRLSHELRTPLTAIVGFSDMIANQTLGPLHPIGYAEYARDIRFAALTLLDSLNEHVDSTLAERNHKLPLGELRMVNLENIIDDSCRKAAMLANKRKVGLRREWGAVVHESAVDAARVTQAIKKILDVSIRAADPSTAVEVATYSNHEDEFVLQLSIPCSVITPSKRAALGAPNPVSLIDALALARGIFEAHGGRVTCLRKSEQLHTVTATLPIRPGQVSEPVTKPEY